MVEDKLFNDTRQLLYELLDYTVEARKELKEEAKKQQKLAEERQKESDRQRAELRRQLGDLTKKMGTLIEDFVAPDLPRILRQIAKLDENEPIIVNVRVKRLHPNRVGNGKRQMIEIDAIAEGGNYLLFNETKNSLRPRYVTDFVETLAIARDYFPEYEGRTIIGVISSFHIDPSIVTHASRQGLVVLALGEGSMAIMNEPDFQWKPF